MRNWLVALAMIGTATAAEAALPVGAKAPDFVTTGALGGKPFRLHLADQLRKGPVVLYFYPKAFTSGCTMEAHAFSEASDDFRKAGATVLGMSADDAETLKRFSVEHCRGKFPVATASSATIRDYDVKLPVVSMTNRTTYVIAPDGRVAMSYSALDWKEHVSRALAAVKALQKKG
ncbi:peroxiredoxin [Sphingomonas ginkgonis]|uniref:thioredoxin-dependent peroxiredoxin n=1 Tax=Sphingomonas ginkgonis TaxID=2315330 RepID=A0A429V791_9SPHN|nr:peroxiredoxin [Sphingomonas ginkgonis]RST29823.1 peroxiredoxin [Sphingomonas ginkgonis]